MQTMCKVKLLGKMGISDRFFGSPRRSRLGELTGCAGEVPRGCHPPGGIMLSPRRYITPSACNRTDCSAWWTSWMAPQSAGPPKCRAPEVQGPRSARTCLTASGLLPPVGRWSGPRRCEVHVPRGSCPPARFGPRHGVPQLVGPRDPELGTIDRCVRRLRSW